MSDGLDFHQDAQQAKEMAGKVANFKWGFFLNEDPGTRALFILEFRKLARRFVEVARRIKPDQTSQLASDLSFEAISPGDAVNLYERLLPLADLIGALDIEELADRRLGPAPPKPITQVRNELRAHLSTITNEDTRAFVDEAVRCFEHELYRSAVIMSWIGALSVLYGHVHSYYLKEFNDEAARVNPEWKAARSTDDLARMKENDFLNKIAAISVIGKNVKQQLENCLTLRNGCGHPNSLKLGPNGVAHHIEILLLNVLKAGALRIP